MLDSPATPQFASDAGKSLGAGVKEAGIAVHQLDWDHLLRPLWGHAARLERQAYAALEKVEERVSKFDQASTPKRLENHFAAWERLSADAEEKIARCDAFLELAQQVDAQFLPEGDRLFQLCAEIPGNDVLAHAPSRLAYLCR